MIRRLDLLVLILFTALAAACTAARKEVDGNIARRIKFEGNGGLFSGQNDLQLRREMQQDGTPWFVTLWPFNYWVEPSVLDTDVLQRDAYRLEVWYAHHGWFDARIEGFELVQIRPQTEEEAGVVDIWGYVKPGRPSVVRTLDVNGLPPVLEVGVGRTIRREAALKPGEQFALDAVERTRLRLLELLHDSSRAYATVTSRVDVHPDVHAVDVAMDVDPGIHTQIGPITISGNDRIATRLIAQNLPIREGQPYKLSDLQQTRQRLFDMSTFSLVTVEPDLSDPTRREVPIEIHLTEARFRTLRLGGGFEYDFGVPRPRLSAVFRHVNLFNQLIQLEARANLGVAVLFETAAADVGVAPTYELGAALSYPRIAGQRVALELDASIVQDVQVGLWMYRQPQANLAVVWRPNRRFAIRGGPHVEQYEFLNLTETTEAAARRLFGTGTTFVNPYQLTALDQLVTYDARDDALRTTRGWYGALALREAIPITEDGFAFGRVRAEYRQFLPIRFSRRVEDYPLVFAFGGRGTYMGAFDDRGIPYPELAFLGGPNSIRGFRTNQVGPYDTLCTYDPTAQDEVRPETGIVDDPVEHAHLPRGGQLALEGTAELRYPWRWGLTLATFVDVGLLERDLDDVSFEDLRGSVGVGARYDTVIGPIRFDVSVRPLYPEDHGPESFIECRHAEDREPRTFDVFSAFEGIREGRDSRPPFALVFYLAIGEAL